MPTASVNGIELYYESHGDGSAVVLLHGAAGNHLSWFQQVPVISERFRCVTLDHRGFGASADATSESGARFVDDLEALLDALGVREVSLVAQSMGGRTALGFAVRHPDRVRALVLADTSASIEWPELTERLAQLREERGGNAGALTSRAIGRRFRTRNPVGAFLYEQVAGQNPPGAADRARGAKAVPVTREQLAALEVPTLFIVGGDDVLTPPEILRTMHAALPGSTLIEVPGCGHSVYFEQPDVFNAAVLDFIDAQTG